MRFAIGVLAAVLLVAPLAAAQDDDLGKDASTEINVKNADISAIIRIFSRKTKRNYILDENVKGKVSIYLPGKVSAEESNRILDAVLALKGFTSVPIGENIWKIIPARDAKSTTIPTSFGTEGVDNPTATVVTRLIPLKFVSAEDMQQLISQLVSPYGLINAYTGSNSLIVIDSEDNIDRLISLIEALDVPFTDREMTIVPIMHAEAPDIAAKLMEILGEGEDSSGAGGVDAATESMRARIRQTTASIAPPQPGVGGAGMPSTFTATVSARARAPKIIADERTNSIIVLADEDTTARIRALISQLDSSVDRSGQRFYVYRLQHANAEELATVLAGLVGGSGGARQTSFVDARAQALGLNTSSRERGNRFQRTQERITAQQRTPGRSRTESQIGTDGVGTVSFSEQISITADPSTNSLIISASKSDYDKLAELVHALDIKRRQVLVEAMLLEVGIDNSTNLGTEFLLSGGGSDGGAVAINNAGNLGAILSDPRQVSGFAAAVASAGTLTIGSGDGAITLPSQTILMNAAQSNRNVNVLSAPNILTADNEEAEIIVGQNVPFLSSTSSSQDNLNNVFNQIDRQDVGITLRLTPRISSGEFVTMKVFTEVSSVILATLTSELGPTTRVRTSETTVIAKDGQMIVIGGLMSDDSSESESGVPFLKDVPVLGHLFRRHSQAFERTNLLIFITPRVIRDQYDARESTIAKRERLQDVIAYDQIYPPRNDVLRNADIDRVSEAVIYDGPKPSTITSPPRYNNISPEPLPIHQSTEEVLEFRVAPRLPGEEAASTNEQTDREEPRASLSPSFINRSEQHNSYLVMRIQNAATVPASIPFAAATNNGYFGIVIPEGDVTARSFFQPGRSYRYSVNGSEIIAAAEGVFASTKDAYALYGDLERDWYTLSPYEIMNVGKGPWTALQ